MRTLHRTLHRQRDPSQQREVLMHVLEVLLRLLAGKPVEHLQ